MGWIFNRFLAWGRKKQIQELTAFNSALRGMDGAEVGLVVALAADVRNALVESTGDNLLYPTMVTMRNPSYILTLTKGIKELQKAGHNPRAAAVMVWAHTVRGITDVEVRHHARAMWDQLSRGFPHAHSAAIDYYMLTNEDLNIYLHDQYPEGLTPTPL